MGKIGRHVTPGLPRTSPTRWRISPTALNVALTVSLPPSQPPSLQLNSGVANIHKFSSTPFFRPCDSRNLNLSPFCDLKASSLVKWQPAINSTYGNITTTYTSGLPGPMRLVYPTEKQQNTELLSSLTKVMFMFLLSLTVNLLLLNWWIFQLC